MRKNQGLGDLDTPEEGHIGFGKNQTKTWKGKKCCCFWTGIQVQERKVIGRRLWNNARHGHSLNLLRASASLFFPRKKKEKFCSVKGSTTKPKKSHHHRFIHVCECRASPPISGWFSTTTKPRTRNEFALTTHMEPCRRFFLADPFALLAFWALKVVDYRQSTMTRFGGKTENPSMHK